MTSALQNSPKKRSSEWRGGKLTHGGAGKCVTGTNTMEPVHTHILSLTHSHSHSLAGDFQEGRPDSSENVLLQKHDDDESQKISWTS